MASSRYYQPTSNGVVVTPEEGFNGFQTQRNHLPQHHPLATRTRSPMYEQHDQEQEQQLQLQSKTCSLIKLKNPFSGRQKSKRAASRAPTSQSSSTASSPFFNSSAAGIYEEGSSHRSTPSLERLLTPPPVHDRSRRLEYEQQTRRHQILQQRRGTYEGEIEPAGVRGQEALVRQLPSSALSLPQLDKTTSSLQIVKPSAASPLHHNKLTIWNEGSRESSYDDDTSDGAMPQQYPKQQLLSSKHLNSATATNKHVALTQLSPHQHTVPLKASISHTKPQIRSRYQQQQQRQRIANNLAGHAHPEQRPKTPTDQRSITGQNAATIMQFSPSQRHVNMTQKGANISRSAIQSDGESTCSDDEIRNMLSDLVPSPHEESSHPPPPNLLHSPSANYYSQQKQQDVDNSSTNTIAALNTTAMNHVQAGNFDAALTLFSQVLHRQLDQHGKTHPATASAYHNLGTVHCKRASVSLEDSLQQRHCRSAALDCFQAAARSARDSLGPNHPNVAVSLVRVGFLLLQNRQYQNAIITFKEALRIRIVHYGPQHGLVANLYNNLGVCCMHLGEFANGRQELEQALQILRLQVEYKEKLNTSPKHGGPPTSSEREVHWMELADTLFNIGGLCLEWIRRQGPDARRAIEAEEAFEEALVIRTRILGKHDPMVLQVETLLQVARSVPRPRLQSTNTVKNRLLDRGERPLDENEEASPMGRLVASNSASPQRVSEPPRIPRRHNNPMESEKSAIFRTDTRTLSTRPAPSKNAPVMTAATDRQPEVQAPLLSITISKDSNDENMSQNRSPCSRIYIAPHQIAASPPPNRGMSSSRRDMSTEALTGTSLEKDSFQVDTSDEVAVQDNLPQISNHIAYSYDTEETCLINDMGVDSEFGRIHYPFAWTRAGIQTSHQKENRDIMVATPFRPLQENNSKKLGLVSSISSEKWGSETVNFSTGNKERDELMARAQSVLRSHGIVDSQPTITKNRNAFDDDLLDDGLAPLGGQWKTKEHPVQSIREMLKDPANSLPHLHAEAARQLKKGNVIDAYRLFEVVLECQRHFNGLLHPDVAAALHNVGIAQLRAQNHTEALKAFEESARVRKGALGKDRPLVAVSLVKVGITLLLLHRFEEALWSFREALSVRKNSLGALHPSTARIYNNIGCVYVEFNEFKEARRAFEAALDTQRSALCHKPDSGPLMFATATTLCNLGYLYRYRDMHAKASNVLKEAVEMQERVLGRSHATVLTTMDNLADSCANSGQAAAALQYYKMLFMRFRSSGGKDSSKYHRAEAILHYKMSRVYRQIKKGKSQLDSLKLALAAMSLYTKSTGDNNGSDTLERRIKFDIRACREQLEKAALKNM